MEKRKSKMGSYLKTFDRRFPLEEIVAAFKHFESQKHFGSRVFDGRFLNPPVGQLRPRIADSCNQSVNPVNPVKRLPLTKKIKRGRTDRDSSPCSRPRQSR